VVIDGVMTVRPLGKLNMANAESIKNHNLINPPVSPEAAIASELSNSVDDTGFPNPIDWNKTQAVLFNTDWTGQNPDPQRQTEVRLLWNSSTIFLKFQARYRSITVFQDADPSGRRDHLWDRDVVEVFLQPDPAVLRRYKEFEIAPNGFWIDLDVDHGQLRDLKSNMQSRVHLDSSNNTWTAELAIPLESLVKHFQPDVPWRVNFFRVEGNSEPRFYSAWRPTKTAQPNFHVPEAFAPLIFHRTNQPT
jgi:alpha-galactosidase